MLEGAAALFGETVDWLNENSGAVIALATTVYAGITMWLLLEARSTRLLRYESIVEVVVAPWEEQPQYLAVIVENFGPANATDMTFQLRLLMPDGSEREPPSRLREEVFPAGRRRTILPDGNDSIETLAADGVTAEQGWSWKDARGRRHSKSRTITIKQVEADYHESGALLEPDYGRELPKIRRELAGLAQKADCLAKHLPTAAPHSIPSPSAGRRSLLHRVRAALLRR